MRVAAAVPALLLSLGAWGCDRGGESPVEVPTPPAHLAIYPHHTQARLGDTLQLSATLLDARGDSLKSHAVTWVSLDPGALRVVAPGHVLALADSTGPTTARVVAAAGALADTATVVIEPNTAGPVAVAGTRLLRAGASGRLLLVTIPDRGRLPEEVSALWTTADPETVTISADGALTALRPGIALVTATAGDRRVATTVEVLPAGYRLQPLVRLSNTSVLGADLNNLGEVVVTSYDSIAGWRGLLVRSGEVTELNGFFPLALNDAGLLVGFVRADDGYTRPAVWRTGVVQRVLHDIVFGRAVDVSAAGEALVTCGLCGDGPDATHALILRVDGTRLPVPSPGAYPSWDEPIALNDAGTVATTVAYPPYSTHAARIDRDGRARVFEYARSRDISPTDLVLLSTVQRRHGFTSGGMLWDGSSSGTPGTAPATVSLGDFGGNYLDPRSLNERLEVVGDALPPRPDIDTQPGAGTFGFVRLRGRLGDLNALTDVRGWHISSALRINSSGKILALAHAADGAAHLVLLDPS